MQNVCITCSVFSRARFCVFGAIFLALAQWNLVCAFFVTQLFQWSAGPLVFSVRRGLVDPNDQSVPVDACIMQSCIHVSAYAIETIFWGFYLHLKCCLLPNSVV